MAGGENSQDRGVLDRAGELGPNSLVTVSRPRMLLPDAVSEGKLQVNPMERLPRTRSYAGKGAGKAFAVVNRAVIGSHAQARAVVSAALERDAETGLVLACLYWLGCRPSEAVDERTTLAETTAEDGTRERRVVFAGSAPEAGKPFTDTGQARDSKGLKWRGPDEDRPVPCPDHLWDLLVAHRAKVAHHRAKVGPCPMFDVSSTRLGDAYQAARKLASDGQAWPPSQLKDAYSLRHTHVSLAVNAGVPTAEVAARVGHSPEECLRTYAHCVEGDRARWSGVIFGALSGE